MGDRRDGHRGAIPGAGPAARRAGPPADGRVGGAGHRAGRGGGRGPGDRARADHGHAGRRRRPSRASGSAGDGCGGRAPDGRPSSSATRACDADLEALIEPTTRGDPESPLRWTTKSLRNLAGGAAPAGPRGQPPTVVASCSTSMGYSLQAEPQDARGHEPPRPRRPVPAHQRRGPAAAVPGRAGHQRGHQEEGAGGALQERRPGAAAQGRPRAGADARLRHRELDTVA